MWTPGSVSFQSSASLSGPLVGCRRAHVKPASMSVWKIDGVLGDGYEMPVSTTPAFVPNMR